MVKYWEQFLIISTYNFVYSLLTSSSPLNRLLIPSAYSNLPRLSMGVLLLCQTAVPSCIIIKAKPPMTYAFIHIPLHFTYPPFDNIPPSKPFFRAAWAFTSLSPSFDTPTRLIRFQKEKVPYHSIRFFATASEGQLFFLFFFNTLRK
jgi:hypothetical protein